MDFNFSKQDEKFRTEVRAFIDQNNPAGRPEDRSPKDIQAWNQKLAEKRWIGFSWPREDGGGGGSVIEQFILKEEMSKAHTPALGSDFMGLAWVGPALIRHGTAAQKDRFLPDLLNGRSVWCTGYSEPDIGSDLAGLQTKAVLDEGSGGSHYVVNGQKIWTTAAHVAKWIFMLVRTTSESESRYGGITCLLIPMDSPGIEVQPIKSLVGYHSFNQVFFNDVRVPVENRLGAEGEGWKVVMGALANERSGISESTGMERQLEDLKELARNSKKNGRPALEDPAVRRELGRYESMISAMRLNGLRNLTKQLQGSPPSTETSVNKFLRGQLEIPMADFSMSLLGTAAQETGPWQTNSLTFHGVVIGGGSPNIQRNIIAERILGLPKD